MNSVNLIGRLARDPDLMYTQSDTAFCRFTLAVDRKLSKEKREQAEQTADFISMTAWGKIAELISNYFSKGSQVGIEGRIQTGSYEKEGQKIYTTDVVVNSVTFVGSKNNNSGGENQAARYQEQVEANGFYPVDNDDIPF